jgi:LysM repeat protein
MTLSATLVRTAALALCGLILNGCLPTGVSQLNEEKEPHYLEGKRRVNALDYKGALESFEKALEVNPQSASAHLEAGLLYEKNQQDFAAAIYHFQHFLKLRPRSDLAGVVKLRVLACKEELAKSVSLGPVNQSLQNEFEKLTEENKRLRLELDTLRAAAARPATAALVVPTLARPVPTAALPAASASNSHHASTTTRTHTVTAGETPRAIARKYGVNVDALLAANPRLDPRRLQVGQALNIPSP